jgi:MSHA biogenesis protein MshK
MAGHLSPRMKWRVHASTFLLAASAAFPLLAQELPDPTRPPPALMAGASDNTRARETPVLQSVLVSPGRRAALIDGTWVSLGGRYADARVVAIDEAAVILQGPEGKRELRLFPEVVKRLAEKEEGTPDASWSVRSAPEKIGGRRR